MSNREQVEAEARGLFPPGEKFGSAGVRRGFVAGRTVSAKQLEAAAEEYLGTIIWMDEGDWEKQDPQSRDMARRETKKVLRAAGLLIEGDDQ